MPENKLKADAVTSDQFSDQFGLPLKAEALNVWAAGPNGEQAFESW